MHDYLIVQNIVYFILLGISMQNVSTNQNIAKLLVNQQVAKVDFYDPCKHPVLNFDRCK